MLEGLRLADGLLPPLRMRRSLSDCPQPVGMAIVGWAQEMTMMEMDFFLRQPGILLQEFFIEKVMRRRLGRNSREVAWRPWRMRVIAAVTTRGPSYSVG